MRSGNLIPAGRLHARRTRHQIRQCAMLCGAFGAAALLVGISCRLTFSGGLEAAGSNLAMAQDQLQLTRASSARAATLAASANNELTVAHRIAGQPDWSMLLNAISTAAGDPIVLKSVNVARRAPSLSSAVAATSPLAAQPTVSIAGDGESRVAVSNFILALEKSGLFSRVVETESRKQTFAGADTLAFKLECPIAEGNK